VQQREEEEAGQDPTLTRSLGSHSLSWTWRERGHVDIRKGHGEEDGCRGLSV
jgi:hypothetical protein